MDFRKLERRLQDVLPFPGAEKCHPDGTVLADAMRRIRARLDHLTGNRKMTVKSLAMSAGIILATYDEWVSGLSAYPERLDDANRLRVQGQRMEEIVSMTLEQIRSTQGSNQMNATSALTNPVIGVE